jgi:putative exporter of polyketide antibiotics
MSYGAPPPPPSSPYGGNPYGGQPVAGTNQKSIWALVLGILGLVCCGIFTGIPALILGNMAKKEINQTGQGGGGMATAGIVLGIIAIVWGVISLILIATGNFYINIGN